MNNPLLFEATEKHDHLKMSEFLLGGENPNQTNALGQTPLHYAIIKDDFESVRILLEFGADWQQPDDFGETPRDLAMEKGNQKIIELIEKARQEFNTLLSLFSEFSDLEQISAR